MWFLFGFLTFATFAGYSLYEALYSGWRGEILTFGSRTCRLRLLTAKGRVRGAYLGVDAPEGCYLALKPERWTGRFDRWAGLSVECRTHEPGFDARFNIVSNDTRVCALLREDARARAAVQKLFDSADGLPCRVLQLRCGAGRLWIHLQATRGFHRDTALALAKRVAPILATLATRLDEGARGIGNRLGDPFVRRAVLLLAISTGLALNGLVHASRLGAIEIPFTLDTIELWKLALLGGGSAVAALVTVAVIAIGYSARAHLVIAELLLVGSFGAVMTTFVELRDLNMEFDTRPATAYETVALGKRISRDERAAQYLVTVRDWADPGGERTLSVSRDLYDRLRVGAGVAVVQKPGYLGFRWIENVTPATDR
jgi:hypothetical protein